MTQRKRRVTEALANSAEPLADLVYAGQDYMFAGIPSQELPHPITFRRSVYSHIAIERYQAGNDGLDKATGLQVFKPALSLMLQREPDAEEGLATQIGYASFGLSPHHMHGPDMPRIDGLLVPESFLVIRGRHFVDPSQGEHIGGGELGTVAEQRVGGGIAIETINATADLVRGLGYGAIAEMFREG